MAVDRAAAREIEDHRAAAEEGLEVRAHFLRIEAPQHGQELALASHPFEKRPQRHAAMVTANPWLFRPTTTAPTPS